MTRWSVGRATTPTPSPLRLRLSYRFEPGSPDDGVTLHIPLVLLNQVRNVGFDWQVAGFRETLVATLAKTLPKEIRREMVPAAETVRAAYDRLRHEGSLAEAFAIALAEVIPVPVTAADVDAARIPDHLRDPAHVRRRSAQGQFR